MTRAKAIIATCMTTGREIRFRSVYATEAEGFGKELVNNCLKGRSKFHAGFTWRYEDPQPIQPSPSMLRLAALRNAGMSHPEIAKEMNITQNWVRVLAGRCITAGLCKPLVKRAHHAEA